MSDGRALFTYGTLSLPDVMHALLGRSAVGTPASLPGWARYRVHGALYPAVISAPEARTDGVLHLGLQASEVGRIDRFEGELYVRRELEVEVDGGRRCADVYVLAPGSEAALSREPWDPREFAEHHESRYVAACRDFRAADVARAVQP